ncbi:MAG TPA: ACP S-malonyltransferase [Acidimicrobiales bacterium]|nr:ACP S-malonyltransferase [Acidimicrobiales bacterium]
MPYAVIFPGQGAAAPGAGRAWVEHPAWDVVGQAEATLDRPLARLLLEADEAELTGTGASQLAMLLSSLVAWEALAARLDEAPVAFAGHSLGQITAVLAAGVVDRSDGLRLAARRADLSQASADARPGAMAALVGVDLDLAARVCEGTVDVWIANDNAPGQVVIAGTPEGVTAAGERARQLGVRRVMALDVGHAFHTPLLADAATGLLPILDRLAFREPAAPVVANTDALGHIDPECWPDQLTRHLVEPVRWRESQRTLAASGATTFIEVGPGRVLAGLAKRTVPDVTVLNVTTPDDLSTLLATNTLAGATR